MRDSDRIDPLLNLIREFWKRHPDLRLGQMITSLADLSEQDVFLIEDENLKAGLEKWMRIYPERG